MKFNAAMFYDIENLLGGYSASRQFLAQIAIEEIVAAVRATDLVDGLAVQRGYADWSFPRLHKLRRSIVKQGITPVQLASFSRGYKNAADIQMAVDIMELGLTRPNITTFIIVSGDGGFLPLVSKLHELGKAVVICAYQSSISLDLKAVADIFVEVEEPEITEEEVDEEVERARESGRERGSSGRYRDQNRGVYLGDPKVVELARNMSRVEVSSQEEAIERAHQVLQWLFDHYPQLNSEGLYLSSIREALTYAIINFSPKKFGFPKFLDFLQTACRGTDVQLVVKPPHSHLVVPRDHPVEGWRSLTDFEEKRVNDESGYRLLLARDPPVIRLPAPPSLEILSELFTIGPWSRGMEKGDVVDWFGDATREQQVKSREIYHFLTTLENLGIMVAQPSSGENGAGSGSDSGSLLVGPDPRPSARGLIQAIKKAAKQKIARVVGKVDPAIFARLFPAE